MLTIWSLIASISYYATPHTVRTLEEWDRIRSLYSRRSSLMTLLGLSQQFTLSQRVLTRCFVPIDLPPSFLDLERMMSWWVDSLSTVLPSTPLHLSGSKTALSTLARIQDTVGRMSQSSSPEK